MTNIKVVNKSADPHTLVDYIAILSVWLLVIGFWRCELEIGPVLRFSFHLHSDPSISVLVCACVCSVSGDGLIEQCLTY